MKCPSCRPLGGSGLDYVILLSEGGWVLITVDYGGGGG